MFENVKIVVSSRADAGPLESVIAAMSGAEVIGFNAIGRDPYDAMSIAIMHFTDKMRGARLIVLVGDRYETLAAALAATFLRIPIAHIHGGETTMGAFDDAFRHSITHLTEQGAGLHFTATMMATRRLTSILGLGEGQHYKGRPGGINCIGSPGLDGIPQNSARRDQNLIVVTYHPETMAEDFGVNRCKVMLKALTQYCAHYQIIFTGTNTDPGALEISETIREWSGARDNCLCLPDMTRAAYIQLLQSAAVVVGNSSSGVIEAPWIGIPSVNLGRRQEGREMANSIYNLPHGKDGDIADMIKFAMEFKGQPGAIYYGGAATKIAEACRKFLDERA